MGPTPQSTPRPPQKQKQKQEQKQEQKQGQNQKGLSRGSASTSSSSSIIPTAITTPSNTNSKTKPPSTPTQISQTLFKSTPTNTPRTPFKGTPTLGLSSNWKKLQETFQKSKEKEEGGAGVKVQVKQEEGVKDEERGGRAGKKRKRGVEGGEEVKGKEKEKEKEKEKGRKGETKRRRMDVEVGGSAGVENVSSIGALAKFAEENDISPEDLSRAYGVDVVKSKKTKGLVIGTGKPTNGSSTVTITTTTTIVTATTTSTTKPPPPFNLLSTSAQPSSVTLGKYLALDCEMVACGPPPPNERSQLARVSIVNYHGQTILDTFVLPLEPVTDWRTPISGVRPSDMVNAIPFHEAKDQVRILLQGRILIGHATHNDLKVLGLKHQRRDTRDTAKLESLRKKYGNGRAPALKNLSRELLGVEIQGGEHSSVVDARACMAIYRLFKREFEEENVKLFGRRRVEVEAPRVVVGGELGEHEKGAGEKKEKDVKVSGGKKDEEEEEEEEDISEGDDDEDAEEEDANGNTGRKKRNKSKKKKKRKRKYK